MPVFSRWAIHGSGLVVLTGSSLANRTLRVSPFPFNSCCRWRDGHAGRGGLPHQGALPRSQAIGLVDEVAEGALQARGFGGEGAAVSGSFLPPMGFTSASQMSELTSATARSLWLGFSIA